METLHLVLKYKWFDMIDCGEKREEYREMTDYWTKRIWNNRFSIQNIIFHRGYSNVTMDCKVLFITMNDGNPKWGAIPGKKYYVLRIKKYEH